MGKRNSGSVFLNVENGKPKINGYVERLLMLIDHIGIALKYIASSIFLGACLLVTTIGKRLKNIVVKNLLNLKDIIKMGLNYSKIVKKP